MSGRTVTRYRLLCDGCEAIVPGSHNGEFESAIEARGAAYAAGWRFPPRLRVNGRAKVKEVSDVCPECLPTWEPQQGTDTWKNRRITRSGS
ncbi:hypothetical protein [Streptosporangium sp. NPDC006930]|uniref:hypothetical protein n=1 Tax=Streptosporangium sp. NPDC006930 TaxID=3154783 RepID=UPI00343B8F9B